MNRNFIETAALTSIARVCESLSFDACRYVGAWLGLGIYAALGKRRGVSIGNVRLALGVSKARANQISRRAVMNFGMTLTEFMHLRVATAAEVRAYSWIEGLEHIENGFAAGKGVILLTGHLGNWEVMGARAAQEFPLTVVARPTGNASVQAHIDAVRAAGGLGVISKYDNGRASLRVLKQNESLGILPDQHAGAEGELFADVRPTDARVGRDRAFGDAFGRARRARLWRAARAVFGRWPHRRHRQPRLERAQKRRQKRGHRAGHAANRRRTGTDHQRAPRPVAVAAPALARKRRRHCPAMKKRCHA